MIPISMPPKWLLTCLSVVIFSCKGKKEEPVKAAPQAVSVDVIVASPQSISNTVEVNGTVIPNEFVELRPEVSGRLTYLNVPEGSNIQQGTVIARINDADLQAQLSKTKVLLDLAEKTEQRNRKLLDIKGLNQADYDISLNTVNGYKADLLYTQAMIAKTVIKAPFSGVVGLKQVSNGAYVSPANIIATIQQVEKLKVDFTAPEEYSNLLRRGNTVDVVLDKSNNSKTKATIVAVEPQANLTTRNLKVRAVLQGSKANPGGFAKIYLDAGQDKKAILVPTNSLIPNDKNNQAIVVKNGKANFVDVTTGVRQANFVEITQGINAGDSVVVTGVLFARPKASVKVRSVKDIKTLGQ